MSRKRKFFFIKNALHRLRKFIFEKITLKKELMPSSNFLMIQFITLLIVYHQL